MKANLLVSYNPSRGSSAKAELECLLSEVNDDYKFFPLRTKGLFAVKVPNARRTIKKLANVHKKNPNKFKTTFTYKPVDYWTNIDIREMQKAMRKMVPKIGGKEKWKLELNKRSNKENYHSLVLKLTEPIEKGKVSLNKPSKTILAEMIGNRSAFSLVKDGQVLKTGENGNK